jgi:hypothetical protein
MQQTFQINTENLNADFIESVKAQFGKRDVKIVIEEVEPTEQPVSQKEVFKKMEELRKKLSHIKVDPNLDLSALANEVNL